MRIQATQINPTVGDIEGNVRKVLAGLERAKAHGADIVLFPEMALLGYPPEDLLLDTTLLHLLEKKLLEIAPATEGLFVAVGLPRKVPKRAEKPLYNSAAIFIDGMLVGFKDKSLLPEYDVFDERRFFEPGTGPAIFPYKGYRIGVTICEDAWKEVGYSHYLTDPIAELAAEKIDLMLNLSASPYHDGKDRLSVFAKAAKNLHCPVVVCNQVGANDQLVFDGRSFCMNAKGELLALAEGFVEEDLFIDLFKEASAISPPSDRMEDLFSALVLGVRDYFQKQQFSHAVLGLSGGIDSAVTACIAAHALGKDNVRVLNMPSRYSSGGGQADAFALAKKLGVRIDAVSIDTLFQNSLDTLAPFFAGLEENITEENIQARLRGMLLMAFSNKLGGLVLTTGTKSEMAMGYTTLYGDMVGALGVLQDVTKTNVYQLAHWINERWGLIPSSILTRAPSPELKHGQMALDRLPPYDMLDPILEDYLEERLSAQQIADKRGYSLEMVEDILKKVHDAEYKRRQAPIGIRVTKKAFSRGRIVPIVQKWIVQK